MADGAERAPEGEGRSPGEPEHSSLRPTSSSPHISDDEASIQDTQRPDVDSLNASIPERVTFEWPEQDAMALSSQAHSTRAKIDGGVHQDACPVHAAAGSGDGKRAFRKSRNDDYVKISVKEPDANRLPSEWWKTLLLFLYAGFSMLLTTVVITAVHEKVPPKEEIPPLPDTFFEYIDRVKWAFTVTEVNGIVLVTIWFLQLFFFNHKSIVFRRYFFLVGTLYLYRCVTMYITTLPVPGMHMKCAPKLYGDFHAKLRRVLDLISGAGLSITNSHILCGDFLYSGHTVVLTLTYLFIKEYSPRSFWWYHLMCWLLSAVGVVCILVAHDHYSVDVVVAYFITTRLFWWYHSLTTQCQCSPNNYLTKTWWHPLFNFMERNVNKPVPCVYGWPVSWAPGCLKNRCKTYSMVQSTRDE
ncbi:phosphatidylcholine:ceramide cholinephosphotransferase 2 [Stigmatopora argus]